ncbi:MAG: M81 family metallopeptidase [Acidobacteria bacterium]|nr:M81 family metallopeptidase [Acidobacteriota bacterium]
MRIYLAGICQESNTFCPRLTTVGNFKRGLWLQGNEILERLARTNTEIGGALSLLHLHGGVDIVPGMAAWAMASGPLTRATLEVFAAALIGSARNALPLDAAFVSFHGALVAEDEEDCEGFLLEQLGSVLGKGVPIVCTLDYHGVLTRRMLAAADGFVAYRTYPHVDLAETGQRAVRLLFERLSRGKPIPYIYRRLPLILPVDNTETSSGPMADALQILGRLDRLPKVYSWSLLCPHPWLDLSQHGVSVIVYLENPKDTKAEQVIQHLQCFLWENRLAFFQELPDIGSVLDSLPSRLKPIALVDSGDVITAGGTGDSTVILRALLDRRPEASCILPIIDPQTVELAFHVGKGQTSIFHPGGDSGSFSARDPVEAKVCALSNSIVPIRTGAFAGLEGNPGRRAVLCSHHGPTLVVSEFTSPIHDPAFLRSLGLEPEGYELIIQKSHKLFKPGYQNIVRSSLSLNTPGFTDPNIRRLPYLRVPRPIFPLDCDMVWSLR